MTPEGPSGSTFADTALRWSVIRVTREVPEVIAVTRPTRPPPVITGSSSSIPELEPLSIVTVEYQTVGERPITRLVTGSRPSGIPPWRSRLTSARSSLFSPIADSVSATRSRSSSTSAWRSSFSPRASNVSPNQSIESRAGLSARSAPSSNGPNTVATPRWMLCSGPEDDSLKWLESSTSETITSSTSTARRRRTCLRYMPIPRRWLYPADTA